MLNVCYHCEEKIDCFSPIYIGCDHSFCSKNCRDITISNIFKMDNKLYYPSEWNIYNKPITKNKSVFQLDNNMENLVLPSFDTIEKNLNKTDKQYPIESFGRSNQIYQSNTRNNNGIRDSPNIFNSDHDNSFCSYLYNNVKSYLPNISNLNTISRLIYPIYKINSSKSIDTFTNLQIT